jgi:hypothetical protein
MCSHDIQLKLWNSSLLWDGQLARPASYCTHNSADTTSSNLEEREGFSGKERRYNLPQFLRDGDLSIWKGGIPTPQQSKFTILSDLGIIAIHKPAKVEGH